MLNLFIGVFLGYIAIVYGWPTAFIIGGLLLILDPQIRFHRGPKLPNQRLLLELIAGVRVHKYSENVVGYYRGNDIHEYIEIKFPADGSVNRFKYHGIIHYNRRGQIVVAPAPDEIFLPTGLVYKLVKMAE